MIIIHHCTRCDKVFEVRVLMDSLESLPGEAMRANLDTSICPECLNKEEPTEAHDRIDDPQGVAQQ